jgi:5-formyltetrahydrofolate cyclo-ligase
MAVPPPLPDEKKPLRLALRAARRDFVAAHDDVARAGMVAAITRQLTPLLARQGPFAGYVAQGDEADILPFLLTAHRTGRPISLPAITRTDMVFARWQPGAALEPGYSGIPQPAAGDRIEPAILLTPLLGFDRSGNRLGQGGGYYDRWFAAHPAAMRIGIAWSVQEVRALVCAPWDMPLHAIVTEKEWIAPS